jgi:hypothetical protein
MGLSENRVPFSNLMVDHHFCPLNWPFGGPYPIFKHSHIFTLHEVLGLSEGYDCLGKAEVPSEQSQHSEISNT